MGRFQAAAKTASASSSFSGTIFPQVELVKQYLGQTFFLYVAPTPGKAFSGRLRILGLDLFPGFNTGRFALFPVPDASADRIAVGELKSARA